MKKLWQPTASINTLRKRSEIISKIRLFFTKNKVLEVETPMLSLSTVTDVNFLAFKTYYYSVMNNKKKIMANY